MRGLGPGVAGRGVLRTAPRWWRRFALRALCSLRACARRARGSGRLVFLCLEWSEPALAQSGAPLHPQPLPPQTNPQGFARLQGGLIERLTISSGFFQDELAARTYRWGAGVEVFLGWARGLCSALRRAARVKPGRGGRGRESVGGLLGARGPRRCRAGAGPPTTAHPTPPQFMPPNPSAPNPSAPSPLPPPLSPPAARSS